MKILFICPEMNGYGGTETVVGKVTSFLAEHTSYDIQLILTSQVRNRKWLDSISPNVKVHAISHNKLIKAVSLVRILTTIDNNDKVVILAANVIPFANKLRSLFHKQWKIISWIHYSLTHQKMFDPHNLLGADEHWAISSSIRDQLIRLGVAKGKIKLIYNPIDQYKGQLNIPIQDETIRLMYVGRILFKGQKNLSELLSAIAKLKQMGKSVEVHIFGQGPDIELCKKFIKDHDICNSVVWHGWTKDVWQEAIDHIHPAALVMTSAFEGLPMVMLEAMSHGIACVSSTFEGYSDVLKENVNGITYQLGNVDQLAHQIVQLHILRLDPVKIRESVASFYEPKYFERLLNIIGSMSGL